MSDSKVQPTPPKLSPTRRHHAARPDAAEPVEDPDNVLAASIGGFNEKIEPYTKPIAVAVIGLVVAGLVWTLYSSGKTSARSDATLDLIQAVDLGDPEILRNVVSNHPDTVASAWASIFRGDNLLAAGLSDLYLDRDSAMEQMGEAAAAYNSGLSVQGDRVLVARAHLGLAKIAEAEGDLEKAVTAYDAVAANAESDEMREFAEKRVELLKNSSTAAFVGWFGEQDFSPADPSLPPSLPGMLDLPESSDLDMPKLEIPGGDNSTIDASSDEGMKLPETLDIAEEGSSEAAAPDADAAEASSGDESESAVGEENDTSPEESATDAAMDDAVSELQEAEITNSAP